MKTIGFLAERYGISRTALLYYDSERLLQPSSRSPSGYRLYSEADEEALRTILTFREAGISLSEIKKLLGNSAESGVMSSMMRRLGEINESIRGLKVQQRIILDLLRKPEILEAIRRQDQESFREILDGAEISFERRHRWHEEFERQSPEIHAEFMNIIGLRPGSALHSKKRAKAPEDRNPVP
jgi:DNA-binding transcriptional MerR regulator